METEQRGIDAISRQERVKSWWDFFTIPAGIVSSLQTLVIEAKAARIITLPFK